MTIDGPSDRVDHRRARAQRWADLGRRAGYGCFAMAIGLFAVGAIRGFSPPVVTIVVVLLASGSVVLAPAIIVGYGVKAAEREDRGEPSGH